jgi:hypothetical protein
MNLEATYLRTDYQLSFVFMSNGWRDLWWCRQSLGPPSGRGILESQNVLQDIVGNLAFPSLGQYIYVSFHHRAMWSVARWRWYFDSQVDVELAALYLDYLSSLICWKGDLHVSWCQTSCGCSLPMNQNWIQHEERVNLVWLYHNWNGPNGHIHIVMLVVEFSFLIRGGTRSIVQ